MWYNGSLFNFEPHKIEKVSVGCVLGKDLGTTSPLDSYQEIDLNKLKERCKQILEDRKQYLYSQLKLLSEEKNKTDEESERYESLCKQLFELGEEQAAIDAPADNSGLPGSTIEWKPAENTEEHVPIIFLNINEEKCSQNMNVDISNESNDSDSSGSYHDENDKSREKRIRISYGKKQRYMIQLYIAGYENNLNFYLFFYFLRKRLHIEE